MKPLDTKLYESVKREANALFLAKTSVYKSAWIVREYKKRGGKYDEAPPPPGQMPTGLQRWFREKWVNINAATSKAPNAPKAPCGRDSSSNTKQAYPLCRPTVRVTKETPTTLQELSPKQIRAAQKQKQVVKEKGRVHFSPV
jgi:hypothetical protein